MNNPVRPPRRGRLVGGTPSVPAAAPTLFSIFVFDEENQAPVKLPPAVERRLQRVLAAWARTTAGGEPDAA